MTQGSSNLLKIDIGCGHKKRANFLEIDHKPASGVDYILDIESDGLPFDDNSVDHVYSSHCFEHLKSPFNAWREISRVIKPGGIIEIWTPYPHSDDQWLIGHIAGWSYSRYDHLSSRERKYYSERFFLDGFWKWDRAQYVMDSSIIRELKTLNMPIDFAVRHMTNIVREWGCFFTYQTTDPGQHTPNLLYTTSRY